MRLLSRQLRRLCWSLWNSQEERVDLDKDTQGKSPAPQARPGEKGDPKPEERPVLLLAPTPAVSTPRSASRQRLRLSFSQRCLVGVCRG